MSDATIGATRTEFITLRDGVRVVADIFLPSECPLAPAVIEITPYRRASAVTYWNNHRFWTDRGYVLVIVDTRGCGDSEGVFSFFRQEGVDGHDIVEWIAAQLWCSGRVGLTGGSYSGTNQWLIARAAAAPPLLHQSKFYSRANSRGALLHRRRTPS